MDILLLPGRNYCLAHEIRLIAEFQTTAAQEPPLSPQFA